MDEDEDNGAENIEEEGNDGVRGHGVWWYLELGLRLVEQARLYGTSYISLCVQGLKLAGAGGHEANPGREGSSVGRLELEVSDLYESMIRVRLQ